MYTADDAREADQSELDRRIQIAVSRSNGRNPCSSYLRIYVGDPWCRTIQKELERRGFVNIEVPDITLKGDVYFEWSE